VLIGMEHRSRGAMTYRHRVSSRVGGRRERGGGLLSITGRLRMLGLNLPAVEMPQLENSAIRSINMVQLGRALTDPELAPPIRALIVYNSNPAAIAPNQNLVLQGLRREDLFSVVIEQFMTDTARHADYILPATTQLEHLDLFWSWGHAYLTLNQPAIDPVGEALPNTEIFRRLAHRMGFSDACFLESDEDMVRAALTSTHPYAQGITYERLKQDGWARLNIPEDFRPFANGGFATASGKCEFYSAGLASQGLDPLPSYIPAREGPQGADEARSRYPLAHYGQVCAAFPSSYANLPRHLEAEGEPLLDLHPRRRSSQHLER
jgi:anaerobic selenocysteine-containing dehydrogenase